MTTRQDPRPKAERIDEKNLSNLIFWCCSFHEIKAKKQGKETQKQKQGSNNQIKKGKKESEKKRRDKKN